MWFKRDLRVEDNVALFSAAEQAREAGVPLVPLFVIEPELWAQPDASARQFAFMAESLRELSGALARLGAPLVVRVGAVTDVLERLMQQTGIRALHSHEETGNGWTFARDRAVAAWCRSKDVVWHEHRQAGVIRRLATRDGWARQWDAFMAQPRLPAPHALLPVNGLDAGRIPSATDLGLAFDACALPGSWRQSGGRTAGLARMDAFLARDGAPYQRAMSSPSAGALHCSRLSPHLAFGTVSMREVAQAAWMRMGEIKAHPPADRRWRGALVSFTGRLHWRDHFTQKLEDEPALEHRALHPAFRSLKPHGDATHFAAWAAGETGLPFLDACMRALIATGWLNFRMRAMLVSVASHHLDLPWRDTGLHLARLFTDYEPGIHWPQVQMQSGLTGINTVRIYNPVKQGLDHDPQGAFIRQWLPELAEVPQAFLHEPWRWDGFARLEGRYPRPITDLALAGRAARDRIFALRKGDAFHRAADKVQEKHGSRKAGLPMTGRKSGVASGRKSGRDSDAGHQGDLFK